MADYEKLLSDTHIMVVDDDTTHRDVLITLLRKLGATVHHAESQMHAIGLFYRLFREKRVPRAIIADWWFSPPGSQEYEFLTRWCPTEEVNRSATCASLLENVFSLDPLAFVAIYTDDPWIALSGIQDKGWSCPVFDRNNLRTSDFVTTIATHPGITRQRLPTEDVRRHLRDVEGRIETGLFPILRTPLPGTIFGA